MWLVRAVVHLAIRVLVGLAIALAVTVLYALVLDRSFGRALVIACYVIGSLTLLLAAAGGSPTRRLAYTSFAHSRASVRFGLAERPGEPRVSEGFLLFLTGALLLLIGVLLD